MEYEEPQDDVEPSSYLCLNSTFRPIDTGSNDSTLNDRTPLIERNRNPLRTNDQNRTIIALALIVSAAALERVSFYSIQTSLQNILDNCFAQWNIQAIWMIATALFAPLIGAWLGENRLGVYRGVVIGLVLELIGCLMLLALLPGVGTWGICANSTTLPTTMSPAEGFTNKPTNDTENSRPHERAFAITGLVFLTLGVSFTRTNIMVLAVQQVPEQNIIDNSIFLWFFWFIELGTACGYAMPATQSYYIIVIMWPVPLAVAWILILLLPFFVSGLFIRPSSRAFRILIKSFKYNMRYAFKLRIPTETRRRLPDSMQQIIIENENDMARLLTHMRRISLFIALHIVYECLYSIQTLWTVRIISDWRDLDTDYSWIADLYAPGIIILLTPIMHFILKPMLRRYWPDGLRQLRLMACGMLMMALSCVSTAVLEIIEQQKGNPLKDLLYEIPQFLFLGFAEIFAYAITYEFIYLETPEGLRNTMLGLYFCSMGLGLYLSIAILAIIKQVGWINVDEPQGLSAGVFLLVLAALQMVVLLFYIVFVRTYTYRAEYGRSVSAAINTRTNRFGSTVTVSDSESD